MSIKRFIPPLGLKKDNLENLTVEGARDALNILVKAGYGDFRLLIEYDFSFPYTGFTDDILVDDNCKNVLVKIYG